MKAARLTGHRKIEFTETDVINPKEKECLIKVKEVSVCGTDTRREFDKLLPEDSYPLPVGTPCHEVAGEIDESKSELFERGDRVLVVPPSDDGLQEYLTLNESRIIKLPDEGSLDEWVMCQHSGTALYASKYWGSTVGKSIAVVGQGGIGISFSMIAAIQGAKSIIGIDINESRLDIAKRLGASDYINVYKDNVVDRILEINEGELADVVIEASGRPDGLNTCTSLVKKDGLIICFGLTSEEYIPFDQNAFLSKNCNIQSTLIAGTFTPLKEIKEMVDLKKRGIMDPGKLKTHNMHWSEVQKAFELYSAHSEGIVKIALKVS